jgi:hypothetical protein
MHQPSARYILSSTLNRYGYNSWPTDSYTVLDPLAAQAVCRVGHLSRWGSEDDLGESTSYIFKSYFFLALLGNFNSLACRNIFGCQKALAWRRLTLSSTRRPKK